MGERYPYRPADRKTDSGRLRCVWEVLSAGFWPLWRSENRLVQHFPRQNDWGLNAWLV